MASVPTARTSEGWRISTSRSRNERHRVISSASRAEGHLDRARIEDTARLVALEERPLVVALVAEEGDELVTPRLRVGAPHLDQLLAECTIEEEVAREVGLVSHAEIEQREE